MLLHQTNNNWSKILYLSYDILYWNLGNQLFIFRYNIGLQIWYGLYIYGIFLMPYFFDMMRATDVSVDNVSYYLKNNNMGNNLIFLLFLHSNKAEKTTYFSKSDIIMHVKVNHNYSFPFLFWYTALRVKSTKDVTK